MKNKNFYLAPLASVTLAFSSAVVADERTFGQIYTECGLGGMIAPQTEGAAAVTNVTWDLGTTAITSHSTTPGTCMGGEARTAQILYDTHQLVERDIARGSGDHLQAVLESTPSPKSSYDELTERLQSDLEDAMTQDDWTEQDRFDRAAYLHDRLYDHVASIQSDA